jgi:nucleoside-diphosphate-sugar epimerase
MNTPPIIALAGAGGDLGSRIAKALTARGAQVRALVRPDTTLQERSTIEALGASIAPADPRSVDEMAKALTGAACVVSALNGLRDVMIDRQTVLLNAAVKACVPRFIPSDYAADFTTTRPGDNRNFDLRREFMGLADRAPIQVKSVLNGAFMDMLCREMPVIQPKIHRVLYWSDADQKLDFTTKDDAAACTAAAAMDETTPRILRIAGDCVSARDIAAAMSEASGEKYKTLWVGSIGTLSLTISLAKRFAPEPESTFPAWQGMQYMRDQFSGRAKFKTLDNSRYPDVEWTTVRELFARRAANGILQAD